MQRLGGSQVDGRYKDFWRWKTQGIWFSAFVLRGSNCFFLRGRVGKRGIAEFTGNWT